MTWRTWRIRWCNWRTAYIWGAQVDRFGVCVYLGPYSLIVERGWRE